MEDEQTNLRELLEEEEESKRAVEKQVATLQTQVSPNVEVFESQMVPSLVFLYELFISYIHLNFMY